MLNRNRDRIVWNLAVCLLIGICICGCSSKGQGIANSTIGLTGDSYSAASDEEGEITSFSCFRSGMDRDEPVQMTESDEKMDTDWSQQVEYVYRLSRTHSYDNTLLDDDMTILTETAYDDLCIPETFTILGKTNVNSECAGVEMALQKVNKITDSLCASFAKNYKSEA